MNIIRKSAAVFILMAIFVGCTACANNTAGDNQQGTENRIESSQDQKVNISSDSIAVNENQAGVYEAEPYRFSKNDIDRFLTHVGDEVSSSRNEDFTTSTQISGSCTSGKSILYIEGKKTPQCVFQYMDKDKYSIYGEYLIYGNEDRYELNSQNRTGQMFTEPVDFTFATAAEAEVAVRDALSTLGLSDLVLLRTLYIDHKLMEKVGNELASNPNYAPLGESQKNNGFTIRNDWSEADDAYMFSFGIPVANTNLSTAWELLETSVYQDCHIIVWYSADGIFFLDVNTPWRIGEMVQGPEDIIPAQEAKEVIMEKMNSILTGPDVSISEPILEYKYRQDRSKWVVFPVWKIKLCRQYENDPNSYYEFVFVDALTGNEL